MSRTHLAAVAVFTFQIGFLTSGLIEGAAAQSRGQAEDSFNRQINQTAAPDKETARTAYLAAAPQDSLKKMSALNKLEDMEQIRLLPLRYSRCITQKDWQCLKDDVFAADFYYGDGANRVHGWEGFIDVMKRSGCYDRVFCRVIVSGQEIEFASPTLARGITTADFIYAWMDLNAKFPVTGKEVVGPGEETETPTYYYQTYVKVDGKWRLRTNDHVSFDMRRTFNSHVKYKESAFVGADGSLPPTH
jgi:SnoaL-like domain